jgi:hypothetical protein
MQHGFNLTIRPSMPLCALALLIGAVLPAPVDAQPGDYRTVVPASA